MEDKKKETYSIVLKSCTFEIKVNLDKFIILSEFQLPQLLIKENSTLLQLVMRNIYNILTHRDKVTKYKIVLANN